KVAKIFKRDKKTRKGQKRLKRTPNISRNSILAQKKSMKTIRLVEIDFEELLTQIETIIERSLEKKYLKTTPPHEERYLNQRDAAEYLGISKASFFGYSGSIWATYYGLK